MEIIVGSKHLAVEVSSALDAKGQEYLVVVAKATWQIPQPGQRPRPLPPQSLEMSDVFVADPGESALLYGSDMVRYKPRCDVIFNASAHTPDGAMVKELGVVWQVGPLRKGLQVHGPRVWRKRMGIAYLGEAALFNKMPLHFGEAFGGTRSYKKGWGDKPKLLSESHRTNPAGMGWYGPRSQDDFDQQRAPSLEALTDPVRKPNGNQSPIAFSAIARHWHPRCTYSGTYDDKWKEEVFPFLPDDFDEQFNQCAPEDQQMPYPKGGELIILRNMVEGRPDVRFKLPKLDNLKVLIVRKDYSVDEPELVADTLYFETDEQRFSVVWRVSTPIKRKIQEFEKIAIGPVSAHWWQQYASDGGTGCSNCGASA